MGWIDELLEDEELNAPSGATAPASSVPGEPKADRDAVMEAIRQRAMGVDPELDAARDASSDRRFAVNMGDAVSQIATGIAGAPKAYDSSDFKLLADAADEPVRDLTTRRANQMSAMKSVSDREAMERKFGLDKEKLGLAKRALDLKARDPKNQGLSKAEEAVDKKFGKDYEEYVVQGGYADTDKQLGQLKESVGKLKKTDKATGPFVGMLPRALRSIVTPEGMDIQESVEEVVQRNLRTVLGAQYTEREGERLISRAYNPKLSEAENVKRIERLMAQIQEAAEAKKQAAQYYEQHGTLKGFKGKLFRSADDFLGDDTTAGTPAPGPQRVVVKRFVSPSTGKTKLVYSDETEEIIDGQ